MKYSYVTSAKDILDGKVTPEYITDDVLKLFSTKEEVFNAMEQSAREEVESLNADCSPDRTFGIPEDEMYLSGTEVKVCCYFENDDTYLVTRRKLVSIKER